MRPEELKDGKLYYGTGMRDSGTPMYRATLMATGVYDHIDMGVYDLPMDALVMKLPLRHVYRSDVWSLVLYLDGVYFVKNLLLKEQETNEE